MNAKDLTKVSVDVDQIYQDIRAKLDHNPSFFKHFIPHFIYVSDETKLQLMRDGFKVYSGQWDGIEKHGLIIEW